MFYNYTPQAFQVKNKVLSTLFSSSKKRHFSDHKPTQQAMEIVVELANEFGLEKRFRCLRAQLAERYGCTERHTTRLFARLIEEDLITVESYGKQRNGKGGWETVRYFKLTGKSLHIIRNSLMIFEKDIHAAPYKKPDSPPKPVPIIQDFALIDLGFAPWDEAMSPEEQKEALNFLDMPGGLRGFTPLVNTEEGRHDRKNKRKRGPRGPRSARKPSKKSEDAPWKIVNDYFKDWEYGTYFDGLAFNDCMEQIVAMIGTCPKTREMLDRMVGSGNNHILSERRSTFSRVCAENGIFPRKRLPSKYKPG
jgi:hypothetical protein